MRVVTNSRGGAYTVTLSIPAACGEREQAYRVSPERYAEAGFPEENDILEGEVLYELIREEEEKRALERAVRILASGDNTALLLERKLRERGFDGRAAKSAVEKLIEGGYLREEDMLLRQFAVFKKRLWGPAKYMPALLSKGFSRELIERVRERASEEGVYDAETVKEELFERFSPSGVAEERALLYKYGFKR